MKALLVFRPRRTTPPNDKTRCICKLFVLTRATSVRNQRRNTGVLAERVATSALLNRIYGCVTT